MPSVATGVRRLLLVLLVVLGWSAPARAADIIPVPSGLDVTAGPMLAGERVAVGEQGRGMPDQVVVREPTGSSRVLARFRGEGNYPRFVLRASPEQIGVVHGRPGMSSFDAFAAAVGPPGGPLQMLEPCPAIDVSGDVFAQRCGTEVRVIGPRVGLRRFAAEQNSPIALAGDMLAIRTREDIDVFDVVTGARLLNVWVPSQFDLGSFDVLDVQEDGVVAFGTSTGLVGWASPAQPYVHRLSTRFTTGLRVGGDLVATAEGDDQSLPPHGVRVTSLDDKTVADVSGLGNADAFDFDGKRIAYETRPCAVSTVVVLAVGEPQPNLGTRCGRPRIDAGPLRFDAAGRVTVTIRCPRTARAGCGDAVDLCVAVGRRVLCAVEPYAAAGGEVRRVRVPLERDVRRYLRRQARPELAARAGGATRRLAVALRR